MTVFLCEDGFDGILTGVYEVYASRIGLADCRLELLTEYEPRLFTEYKTVFVDNRKAEKVAKKIREFMSEEAYIYLYRAALHKRSDRADWILRFVEVGLKYGKRTVRMLQDPAVYEIFQMNRYVGREALAQKEFVRFERLRSGIYYSVIGPENQVLELIAGHFADRFPDMNWVIYDEKHRTAAIHSAAKGEWVMKSKVADTEIEKIREQAGDDMYEDLWKVFFHTIAIEERRNYRCQRNLLPLRYRKYMTEFQ